MTLRTLIVSLLVTAVCLLYTGSSFGEEAKFDLNPSYTMKDVLNAYAGKRVSLRLGTGEALEGIVTKVGTNLVHIAQLTGKDYYDAVVVIDKVEAVVLKVRGK